MRFSEREINDLLISWVVLSVAFAIFMSGFQNLIKSPLLIAQMFVIVGTAFVLHELSHKYVAQKYGLWAEYRKWTWGLILAFFLALTRVIFFAAPGAVMIMSTGWVTPEIEAKTSIAGPISNITVGTVALLIKTAGIFASSTATQFLTHLAVINFFLAVFNLLPFPPMDGSKVLKYNVVMWVIPFACAIVLLFVTF